MFRFTRSVLCLAKKMGKDRSVCRSVTSNQNFVKSVKTDSQVQQNVKGDSKNEHLGDAEVLTDIVGGGEVSPSEYRNSKKGFGSVNFQSYLDRYSNSLELSKIMSDEEAETITSSLTPWKAIQIMKFLSTSNTRPVKLLKALTEKICDGALQLSLKQTADVMYCLGIFSLKNEDALNKLALNILKNKEQFKKGVLASAILRSCGVLKYRNCELIDLLLENLQGEEMSNIKSLLEAVKTLAMVNYFPERGQQILDELLKYPSTDFSKTKSFLELVWVCILLGQYPNKHISVVLSDDFVNQLQVAEGYFGYTEPIKMKLLNINAAAQYLAGSYDGPRLKKIICKPSPSRLKDMFLMSVVDGLSHIFPKNGYLNLNVNLSVGFNLDIECYMDSKGQPITLVNKKKGKKIGLLLLTFNDFCLDRNNTENGLVVFKEKLFSAMGYKVVKIAYNDYNNSLKLYEKVHYLQEKLRTAYAGE